MSTASARISLRPGRELHWSPSSWDGDDQVIVFDACSGDFWVLSTPASQILRQVLDHGPVNRSALQTAAGLPAGTLDELVQEMAQRGLLRVDAPSAELASGD